MDKITKWQEVTNGFMPSLAELLQNWKPESLENEKRYEDSLFSYLKENIPNPILRQSYPEAGSIIDIYLKWKGFYQDYEVFFELKYNLQDEGEFKRLAGQVFVLEPSKRNIVVILCEKTREGFISQLKDKFHDYLLETTTNDFFDGFGLDKPCLIIIAKN